MHPVEHRISLSHYLPVGFFYRSQHFFPDFGIHSTQVTFRTETISPANLKIDSKESCLFQQTSFDKGNRLKCCRDCFLLRISNYHKFSIARQASFFVGVGVWGVENSTQNNRTIIPVTLYLRKASQYFTDTMITTYEALNNPYHPWDLYIYLHLPHRSTIHVGK